jgi:hypothetical protein
MVMGMVLRVTLNVRDVGSAPDHLNINPTSMKTFRRVVGGGLTPLKGFVWNECMVWNTPRIPHQDLQCSIYPFIYFPIQ